MRQTRVWKTNFLPKAARRFRKLDPEVKNRILKYLDALTEMDDPRSRGKALTGIWSGFWRWRVGDYRLIGTVENKELVILIVEVGHRSDIYDL